MTTSRRLYLTERVHARIAKLSDDAGMSVSDWLRHVLSKRTNRSLRPLSDEVTAVNVRVADELDERIDAAALRAGLTTGRWMRCAVEAEIGDG